MYIVQNDCFLDQNIVLVIIFNNYRFSEDGQFLSHFIQ